MLQNTQIFGLLCETNISLPLLYTTNLRINSHGHYHRKGYTNKDSRLHVAWLSCSTRMLLISIWRNLPPPSSLHLHLPYPEDGWSKSFRNIGNHVPDYVMSVTSQQTVLFIVPIIRTSTITQEICGSDSLKVITLVLVSQKLIQQPIHIHTKQHADLINFLFLPDEQNAHCTYDPNHRFFREFYHTKSASWAMQSFWQNYTT